MSSEVRLLADDGKLLHEKPQSSVPEGNIYLLKRKRSRFRKRPDNHYGAVVNDTEVAFSSIYMNISLQM